MLSGEMKALLNAYAKQDFVHRDVTANSTPKMNCTASIRANEECTLAGAEETAFLFRSRGVKVKLLCKDGSRVKKNSVFMRLSGQNRKILSLERVCLNILGRMSGVATMCSRATAKSPKAVIAVTRKTVPGFQLFDKKAAEVAGAWSHRKNLSNMILLKENHLAFFNSTREAIKAARKKNQRIEIEAESRKQALEAASEKPFMIMLDNFSPKQAKTTIRFLKERGYKGRIELSGGITLKNLGKYSRLGADVVSMGELTRKAPTMDFSLEVKK